MYSLLLSNKINMKAIFRGVEGSWVTAECVSDDNDRCVHENRAHTRAANTIASSFLLNKHSERVTLKWL